MRKVKKQMKGGVIYKSGLFYFCKTGQGIINQFINQMEVSMRKVNMCLLALLLLVAVQSVALSQEEIVRLELNVPKVSPADVVIDGVMDESVWGNAAEVNLVTETGYNIWASSYGREIAEPEYDELYGRLLWTDDTLYVFMHIDEFVNDTTDLYWGGQFLDPTDTSGHWASDQLFIGVSNRLGVESWDNWEGNPMAAPDGPYHLMIMGDRVTFNDGYPVYVPELDSAVIFDPSTFIRSAAQWNEETGVWDVELAIYNPNVKASASVGFNVGGSFSSTYSRETTGDSYGYYTWQPNVPNEPFADPGDLGWCATYIQQNSEYWALLNFLPGPDDVIVRLELNVPKVSPADVVIDGVMDESVWGNAAEVNLVTETGYNIWASSYGREIAEPEYDELYGRLLWTDDTLYVFMHIDEFVNDTTDLYWGGQFLDPTDTSGHWASDQLFIGVSNRLGVESWDNWEGNPMAAPDGPYHLMIMGDRVTFNDGYPVYVPELDSAVIFDPSTFIRSAAQWNEETGVWDVELAIYNPNVKASASVGFNVGGSFSSTYSRETTGDSYGYYTWQPNVPNEPFADPGDLGWCATYIQQNSEYWALLNFGTGLNGIDVAEVNEKPVRFALRQNYPNPFNPTTTIRFEVNERVPVTLKVYNVLGKEVATLIDNRTYSPGVYSVIWDGSSLSSGIYFYQLVTDKVVSTRKMILMK